MKTLLSWSSGKDSAFALWKLRQNPMIELAGLVTTVNQAFGRVAMHAVREALLQEQADAAGLPLWTVPIPNPCSNEQYEAAWAELMERARDDGVESMAFGDLYLEDIRDYRKKLLEGTGIRPHFPIWVGRDGTSVLAERMIETGVRAHVTCIDPKVMPREFAGRVFDASFLEALPEGIDPLGENGEFHTFCFAGPMFDQNIEVVVGETVERDGFMFTDLLLPTPDHP